MTVLSDRDIKAELAGGGLVLDPAPDAARVQPASIDFVVDLSGGAKRPDPDAEGEIVVGPGGITGAKYLHDPCVDGLLLKPGECALVTTLDHVEIPPDLAIEVCGRSSIGRLFLAIHVTAGWCDPGFKGQVTLELHNAGPRPIRILDRAPLGQFKVARLSSVTDHPYGSAKLGSHYQGQTGATVPAQTGEVVK